MLHMHKINIFFSQSWAPKGINNDVSKKYYSNINIYRRTFVYSFMQIYLNMPYDQMMEYVIHLVTGEHRHVTIVMLAPACLGLKKQHRRTQLMSITLCQLAGKK